MERRTWVHLLGLLCLALVLMTTGASAQENSRQASPAAAAVGTGFTYQGRLTDAGSPANCVYDFDFRLYDALNGGSQLGGTVAVGDVAVANGLFTVQLDFGAVAFQGAARWLEIAVRPGASTGAHTALTPRQPLTPAPYVLHAAGAWSMNGTSASNPAFNFIGTIDEQPLIIKTNNGEQVRVLANGNVGVGTASPDSKVQISYNSGSQGLHLVNHWGSGGETDVKLSTAEPNGVLDKSWFIGTGGSARGDVAAGSFGIAENAHDSYRLFIKPGGNVGIGTTDPIATLTVRVPVAPDLWAMRVEEWHGYPLFVVHSDGRVSVGAFDASTTTHVCMRGTIFSLCNSAAEYVPGIDGGRGFPEASDVVSLVPNLPNPYGDEHASPGLSRPSVSLTETR